MIGPGFRAKVGINRIQCVSFAKLLKPVYAER